MGLIIFFFFFFFFVNLGQFWDKIVNCLSRLIICLIK